MQKLLKVIKNHRVVSGGFLSLLAVPAFAQSTTPTIDATALLALIAAGAAAYALIGPAWSGFKYLKKVWNKV